MWLWVFIPPEVTCNSICKIPQWMFRMISAFNPTHTFIRYVRKQTKKNNSHSQTAVSNRPTSPFLFLLLHMHSTFHCIGSQLVVVRLHFFLSVRILLWSGMYCRTTAIVLLSGIFTSLTGFTSLAYPTWRLLERRSARYCRIKMQMNLSTPLLVKLWWSRYPGNLFVLVLTTCRPLR